MGFSLSLINGGGLDVLCAWFLAFDGIGSAFLVKENARGTLQCIVGIVAAIQVIWSFLLSMGRYGNSGSGLVFHMAGIGVYLFIIGAITLIIGGMAELKKCYFILIYSCIVLNAGKNSGF